MLEHANEIHQFQIKTASCPYSNNLNRKNTPTSAVIGGGDDDDNLIIITGLRILPPTSHKRHHLRQKQNT
jgi:hypothetical protein